MQSRNFDGISKSKKRPLLRSAIGRSRALKIDSIVKRKVSHLQVRSITPVRPVIDFNPRALNFADFSFSVFWQKLYFQRRISVFVAGLALIVAFLAGAWFTLSTPKSVADQPAVLSEAASKQPAALKPDPNATTVSGQQLQGQPSSNVSSEALFNTPIEQLQQFLANVSEPDVIANRKVQLEQFLKDRHSPLLPSAETIAEQNHWQLILAIAFAESSLGKNCNDNNCSNIGVAPDSPYWRKYANYDAWIVDFNRLLEKKYKDWTLEQMCGVYVKPCSDNWLSATKQILADLNSRGIE